MFRTRYNYFEYIVILFDLINISIIFQTLINKILRNLINYICVVYLDDILIYSKIRKEHWDFVKQMLKRLQKFKFYVKLFKCCFIIQSVEFLEYIISNYSVFINSSKINSIRTWLELKTLRKLQVFLRFANFYRRFVKYYAKIIQALTKLLKRSKQEKQNKSFIFDKIARTTFVKLVVVFITTFMLIYFDSQKSIRVEIDASRFAIVVIFT